MLCKKCKKEIDNNSKFCEFCGYKTKENMSNVILQGRKSVLFLLIFVSFFLFYWYELRPSQIKKECDDVAQHKIEANNFDLNLFIYEGYYDKYFKQCLNSKGL